jgi:hypothetical protein
MQPPKLLIRYLPPGILAIFLIGVYLISMAPGLTWANLGSDGGDLITAAAIGGVAHPTGYPSYLVLVRLFQLLPVGSLAFRTSLMSALAAAAASVLVNTLVTQSLPTSKPHPYWLAGLAAGAAFGLSPLLWSQAVITEVYTLHSFLVVLILYLSAHNLPGDFLRNHQDKLLGLIFGLAMGNHLTTILLLPVMLFTTFHRGKTHLSEKHWLAGLKIDGNSLLQRVIWGGIGLLVYFILPIRALSHPAVNWGNPVTLDGFLWLVSGKLYQGLLVKLNLSSILERGRAVVALLLQQFGVIGLLVGLIGSVIFFKPNRLNLSMLWIVIASASFTIVYATTDAFLYLIPGFLCFAVWIGLGLGGLMDVASRYKNVLGPLAGLVLIFVLLIQAWHTRPSVDASHDARAEAFGKSVISIAPAKALVFAKGDEAVFTLWYFQYAERNRPDLAIVATDLLGFQWYLQTLQSTYPDLKSPVPFPFPETLAAANPGRPVCYVQYIQTPEINCLPAGTSRSP